MKTYATPILLVAAALTLALLLSATTRTSSSHANAPVRPTFYIPPERPAPDPAAAAGVRVTQRHMTRAACHYLYGRDSDSHGELGACLAGAR
jgi:hypothetical protein